MSFRYHHTEHFRRTSYLGMAVTGSAPQVGAAAASTVGSGNLEKELYLDGHSHRQLSDADGGTRVLASLAKNI